MTAARIAPLEPPFAPEVESILTRWMPPSTAAPPLALFRVLARHPMLLERMRPLGAGLLGHGTLPVRVRELLILRTSARCGARYEWGVHVAGFAQVAGLDDDAVRATATLTPAAVAARDDEDALVLRVADELHDASTLSDVLFAVVNARWGEVALLEMAALVGFYHLIAFVIRTARLSDEPWAAPFPGEGSGVTTPGA
jgi:4-carboxymuconolactone decarboxylase